VGVLLLHADTSRHDPDLWPACRSVRPHARVHCRIGPLFYRLSALWLGFGHDRLDLFRALQGCGAGAVQPIAYTIVGDIYTPAERARLQGPLSGVFGAAAIVGRTLGAYLVAAGSRRYVFWINLPISAAAIIMILAFLRESSALAQHKLDLMGALLFVVGIGAVLLAADRGQQMGPVEVALMGALGIASLAALVRHEPRASEPMLPLDLWKNRLIVLVSLGSFTVGAVIMSLIAFLPSFIQASMGRGADAAGLVFGGHDGDLDTGQRHFGSDHGPRAVSSYRLRRVGRDHRRSLPSFDP
jgi:MFS family permease